MCAPIRSDHTVLGALTLFSESRPPPEAEIRGAIETVATLLGGVIERRMLDRTIAELSLEEQHRIGGDLHDSVSQDLSGAALLADGVARRLEAAGGDDAESVRHITDRVRDALSKIRCIVEGLIPVKPSEGGLNDALERLIDTTRRWSDTRIIVRGEAPDLPAAESRELFLIASEAVRNAVTHADASAVEIAWRTDHTGEREHVTLEIRDDGRGMPNAPGHNAGRGISIMRYRASLIDGIMEVISPETGGTVIRCRVPIPSPRGERASEGSER